MYSPRTVGIMPPVFLHSHTLYALRGRQGGNTVPGTAAWTLSNRIIYVPFVLSMGVTVYRYFWLNGTTVGTNNLQVGVYDVNFNAVNRGTSTLSAGTVSLCQFDNITDYSLSPGRYYMALWCNGTTATVFRTAANYSSQGLYYETNASGLPTTGTPVDPAVINPACPLFGLALRATDP